MSSSCPQPGRVLILENDYSNRILFADYLEQCGYRVFPLADEQKILESLADFDPHVLILNLKMPFLDGFSVIEQLRSHPRWASRLAILVVSGYSLVSDKQKAYRSGANAYLTKPMLPAELSSAVAELMKLKSPTQKPILSSSYAVNASLRQRHKPVVSRSAASRSTVSTSMILWCFLLLRFPVWSRRWADFSYSLLPFY